MNASSRASSTVVVAVMPNLHSLDGGTVSGAAVIRAVTAASIRLP